MCVVWCVCACVCVRVEVGGGMFRAVVPLVERGKLAFDGKGGTEKLRG